MKKLILVVLLLSACAPQVQPTQPVEGFKAELAKENAASTDDTYLPMRKWLPKGKPRAVVLALHGFNDYSNAFEGTGQYLSKRGIAVYAYDQRGFGKTAQAGIWAGQENLVADVRRFAQQLAHEHPRIPLYILGESMGGAIAITAVTSPDFPKIDGLILSAPGLWGDDSLPLLYRATLWSAAHTFPGMKLTGSNLRILACSDIATLKQMGRDPLVIKATRIDSIYGLVHIMDSAFDALPEIKSRTLLLYGHHDQVIPAQAMNKAVPRFSVPIDMAYYPEGYHMLLRDLDRQVVLKDIASWITRPKAPLPSGFGLHRMPDEPAPNLVPAEHQ